VDPRALSDAGRAIYPLLTGLHADAADTALRRLPASLQERLMALSPTSYVKDLRAPLVVLGHDRDDLVVPVSESRHLRSILAGHAKVHYTEFGLFQHADPTKRKLPPWRLFHELARFFLYIYPVYRAVGATRSQSRSLPAIKPTHPDGWEGTTRRVIVAASTRRDDGVATT